MEETVEKRWFRWDKMMNNGEYQKLIKEFDQMVRNKKHIVVGDLIRRDQALEEIGVISISPMAMQKRKTNAR